MKLWPLALAPLWLASAFRRGGAREAFSQGAFLLLGVLAPAVLVLPRAGALMAGLAAPAVVLLALAPQIAALRSSRTLRPGTFLRAAAAAVVGVLVGSNSGVRDSWFE